MVRRFAAGMLAAVLLLLSACAGSERAQGVDPIALGETMTEQATDLPTMSVVTSGEEQGESLFPYLSDLDYHKIDGYYFAYAEAGTAEEIAVIRLKDAADVDEAKASLERHLQNRKGIFEAYDPEQIPMVEDARIISSGPMVILVICKDADSVVSTFRQRVEA